ncbi:hypothetical protein CEXT_135311 [Caerostris extrusa]|uniref:Uncharacterized protein n=1 Tax=Caerostris extrusa TaxID=172846 RepID=A0AAV4UED2_CAEEX|nr:hypothetical protein CEXT_135311 [Caerostris extrusa]
MLIIIRLMSHLQIVEDLSPDDSGAKRILTIDRTLQIIEIIPWVITERASVQARVKMERDDDGFSYGIQKELKQIATSLEPFLVCQILRVLNL